MMNEINNFLDENAQQIAREVDRMIIKKLKKIATAIDQELTGEAVPDPGDALASKHQLRDLLNALIESSDNGRPADIAGAIEQLKRLGYVLDVQQPNFRDYVEFVPGPAGSHSSSLKVVIPESEFKVRLYKMEYEV